MSRGFAGSVLEITGRDRDKGEASRQATYIVRVHSVIREKVAGHSQTVGSMKALDRLVSAPASRHRGSSAPQQLIDTNVHRTPPDADVRARFVLADGYFIIWAIGLARGC
jgi:hypothetical protein